MKHPTGAGWAILGRASYSIRPDSSPQPRTQAPRETLVALYEVVRRTEAKVSDLACFGRDFLTDLGEVRLAEVVIRGQRDAQ